VARAKAKRPLPQAAASPLPAAVEAARAQHLPQVLGALLHAWKTEPSDGLAELITGLSRKLRTTHNLRGKSKAALAAWIALATKATPRDLPALLETLTDATSGDALKRLTYVARWMPDPRVDAAIVDVLERVPYRATSTRPFWVALFELAEGITDPRALRRLEHCDADGVALTMQAWLRQRIGHLREITAAKLVVTPEPPEAFEIARLLGDQIGPGKLSRGSKNLEALLEAIYAAPDDDAPRLVYADALIERGDPRGELISLQLRGALDRDGQKREKELLATYGKQWLGELAPIVMSGFTFERGFLASCRIDNRHIDRVRKLAAHPAWATVRTLSGSALIGLSPVMRGLRSLSFVSYEARNHEGLPDSWRDLLVDTERPLESLRYAGLQVDEAWEHALENNESVRPGIQGRWVHVPQATEVAALCSCRALPKLRELIVVAQPDVIAPALLGSALARRLDTVGFVYDPRGPALAELADAFRTVPVPRLRFELGPHYHVTELELARGDRSYQRATLTVGPTRGSWSANEAIALLDELPATVRELHVTIRKRTDPQQAARLRAAAEQKRLDVCDVSY
jgi:uncharacterized protein (TIGR02996 family)